MINAPSDEWLKIKFGDISENVVERTDIPSESGYGVFVGGEHLDSESLKIKRWGSTSDVHAQKLLFKKGQILFGKRNAYLRKVAYADFDGVCSAHIMVLQYKPKFVEEKFFPFFMQSDQFWERANMISEGSMSPTIKWKILGKQEFFIPPKKLQQKIAGVLWTLEESINKKDEIVEVAKRFKKALMKHLLTYGAVGFDEAGKIKLKRTKIGLVPEKWEVMRLGDVVDEIKNGFASGKRDENGIIQIRMNNVTTDGRLIFDSYLKVPVPKSVDEWLLKKGDLLFNNTNSIDLVGKSTIFNNAPFPCTFSNHFTRIRFKKDLALPELIHYHFLILWEKSYFKSVAIRHVGQAAVHTDYLLKLQIPLPSLPEQHLIVKLLSKLDQNIEAVKTHKGHLITLKKRLLNGLLSGEIRLGGCHK
jgi:type I restriction enzyme S subunit